MMNSKEISGSKKMKEKDCSKLMRRVKGLKKKAEQLSILCGAEISLMITDPSSSSSSSSSSSFSRFCYSWPENLELCTSLVQRYASFNHQKEMMISQKKRKFDCLNSTVSSTDKKLKKPMSDSSLSTDFSNGFDVDDDLQCLLSMMDSKEKSIQEKIRLLTENQPKEGEGIEPGQILGSEHCETENFEGLEMISEMGNSVSADLCDGLDDGFQFLSPEADFTQIQLLNEAHEVEQSDVILGFEGKNSDDLEGISEEFDDDELQCLLSEVDSSQIQLFTDEPEQAHDQLEILGHYEDSEMLMINEMISEYQNLDDMEYGNLIGNFEQDFEVIPKTSDDYLMQGSCNFSSGTNQTLNDSWHKLPMIM